MAKSQWHRFYNAKVAAQPAVLFALLSDMPNYGRWLPQSRLACATFMILGVVLMRTYLQKMMRP